jgi:isopentenyl-diphosphate delta-isomerase
LKLSVILTDENDRMTGTMDKQGAHIKGGRLHRAVSVFIFNSNGELLLQQRAASKYHSAGKWSNTSCSHPGLGEQTNDAAYRSLNNEMGILSVLDFAFSFTYRVELENGITEHEFDHVYFGISDDIPEPNPLEVADFRYMNMDELATELKESPEKYSKWLAICYDRVLEYYHQIIFV